jgi:hypothetical protein
MNRPCRAQATATSLADRLETLAGFWQDAPQGKETRPTPPAQFDILRDGLNAIALEADAADQGGLARALQRIALLSEVWECLQSEPDQAEATAQLADFCKSAIEHLVRDQRTGSSGDLGTCDGILCQSDERWRDYLSAVDPASAGQSVVDEEVSFDEGSIPHDDDPPVLDQETLLRLLQGAGDCGKEPAPREPRRIATQPREPQSTKSRGGGIGSSPSSARNGVLPLSRSGTKRAGVDRDFSGASARDSPSAHAV